MISKCTIVFRKTKVLGIEAASFFEVPAYAGMAEKDIADSPTLLGIESIETPIGKHPKTKNSENKFRSFNIILLPFAFQSLP
ncbi:MAG: hypothetical protein Wins2KO_23070 [Winogradskyella sp.]